MKSFWTVVLLIALCPYLALLDYVSDYMQRRAVYINEDNMTRTGHDTVLSEKELVVSNILEALIRAELDSSVAQDKSIAETNFILAKKFIDQSAVFDLIRRMPKGALHHIHLESMASYEWLLKKWTYKESCYMCYDTGLSLVVFKISSRKPSSTSSCDWVSVPDARRMSGDPDKFDADILANLTLTSLDMATLDSQLRIWNKFANIFVSLAGILTFEDAFIDYYIHGLKELVNDNIQFAEIRSTFLPLYDLNGTVFDDPEYILKACIEAEKSFTHNFSYSYFGSRYIYSVLRTLPNAAVATGVEKAIDLYEKYPDSFAGFDLVGQEDTGQPLLNYLDELLLPKKLSKALPYFLHAGETDWEGEKIDENLFDALLLNTTRIGHGYAIIKHPFLKRQAKKRPVPLEVCPISNQVLGLVHDLRNHPASILLSENQPLSINPDDPAVWGATGVSYDYYEVVMGMLPGGSGLAVLKTLARNSVTYTSLADEPKSKLMAMWQRKWDAYIDEILNLYGQNS